MRLKRQITCFGLLLALLGSGPAIFGQEESDAAAAPTDDGSSKIPFALFVEMATGGSAADDLSTSLVTSVRNVSDSLLSLDDFAYAKAGIGWKLQHGKGDFRLTFHGYREDNYLFSADGYAGALDPRFVETQPRFNDNPLWWSVRIENGQMQSERTPPGWQGDLNSNEAFDIAEVEYPLGADLQMSKSVTDDLQNRTQFVDLMYGRTFGTRTFGARWWSGLRYFVYEGNVPVGAWLYMEEPGVGFTDGFFARLLQFSQQTKGWGPTGILEGNYKMADERIFFYLRGQIAFMMLNLDIDSGPFLTYVWDSANAVYVPVDARLQESRNKSTWQDMLEAGMRLELKNGVQLEIAYNITGLLDVVLLPTDLKIPANQLQVPFGSSALYNTQDIVLDGWRAGFAFQF
jgi:hypothetical protein